MKREEQTTGQSVRVFCFRRKRSLSEGHLMARGSWKPRLTSIALFIACLLAVAINRPAPAAGQGLFELPLLHGCAWPFI
jgi:hypothetical protein